MICVYGLFKPSLALELGINRLRDSGFGEDSFTVVALDPLGPGKQSLLDSMDRTDGMSLMDGITMAASIGMLLGVIYGSHSQIGPVGLGLVGSVAGGALGLGLDLAIRRKRPKGRSSPGEVIVCVRCASQGETLRAEAIMRESQALALGRGGCMA